jgi:hypothetical protein
MDFDFDVVNGDKRWDLSVGGLVAHDFDVQPLLVDQDIRNTMVLELEPFLGADKIVDIADIGLETLDEHIEFMLAGILGTVVLVGTARNHADVVVHVKLEEAWEEVGACEDHVVKHQVNLHIRVLDAWDRNELERFEHCWHENVAEVVKQVRLELELSAANRWLRRRGTCNV